MTMIRLAVATMMIAASSAQAQVSVEGDITANFLNDTDETWSAADFDFTLGLQANEFLSFELGVDASRTQFPGGVESDAAMAFATVSFHTGVGRFQIGRPRTLIEDYVTPQRFVSDYFSKIFLSAEFYSMAFDDIYFDINQFHGARWDHQVGNTSFGAAVIEETDGSKDTYWQFAISHEIGRYQLALGIERETTDDETSYFLSADADWGPLDGKAFYRKYDDGSGFDVEFYNLGLTYDVNDRFSVEASHTFMSSFDDRWTSIGANYDVTDQAYVGLAYGEYNFVSEPLWSLVVGWRLDY